MVAGAESFFFHLWDTDWNSWNCSFPVLLEDCSFRSFFSSRTLPNVCCPNKLLLLFCLYFFGVSFNCLQLKNPIICKVSLFFFPYMVFSVLCSIAPKWKGLLPPFSKQIDFLIVDWIRDCPDWPWWPHWRDWGMPSRARGMERWFLWNSNKTPGLGEGSEKALWGLGLSRMRAPCPKQWQDFKGGWMINLQSLALDPLSLKGKNSFTFGWSLKQRYQIHSSLWRSAVNMMIEVQRPSPWFSEHHGRILDSGETLRRKETLVMPEIEILASLGGWEVKMEINLI